MKLYQDVMAVSILLACCVFTQAGETSANLGRGLTGIVLTKGNDFPIVSWIYPDSPAANEGSLRPGDVLLSVSPDGGEFDFISTRGMSIEAVASLLRGRTGSAVTLKVCHDRVERVMSKGIIRLRRADMVEFEAFPGAVARAFLGTNVVWSPLVFRDGEVESLQHVGSEEWSKVTNGMDTAEVVRILGQPLVVESGREAGELSWRYGWHVRVGSRWLKPGTCELFIRDGLVSETFRIKQPSEDDYRVEILSTPCLR